MVIGKGLIAKVFLRKYLKNKNIIIFASGVSNSNCNETKEFSREKRLLKKNLLKKKKFIYFSSSSVLDKTLKNQPYVKHKLQIEKIIKKSSDYIIFRVSQIASSCHNPNTLLNFIFEKIKKEQEFYVQTKALRNIIDIEDLKKIVIFYIEIKKVKNKIIQINSPKNSSIMNLVKIFEKILKKKAKVNLIKKGGYSKIDKSNITDVRNNNVVHFQNNYIENVLKKYYDK
jgi:nucleoside-diphosphate-sugar epimerase